jgi:hypothetical protein
MPEKLKNKHPPAKRVQRDNEKGPMFNQKEGPKCTKRGPKLEEVS